MNPQGSLNIGLRDRTMRAFKHLYGPVPSRRLGRSLGVDLLPNKICTYDCIYCQTGKTTKKTLLRKEYVPQEQIMNEVRTFLKQEIPIDYFSLSGSGEPTLHSKIGSVIERIKNLSSVPVAVITNGSLLYEEGVREDLLRADVILPSLDAVSSEVFLKINRPLPELSPKRVIEGMVNFRRIFKGQIWLEILLCKDVNDMRSELERMKEAVKQIQPDLIHLNTVVRPPSEKGAIPLSRAEMEEIRSFFGEKASIISKFDRHVPPAFRRDTHEGILRILRRRPLSLVDISKGMGIPPKKLEQQMGRLVAEGKIETHLFRGRAYYEISRRSTSKEAKS